MTTSLTSRRHGSDAWRDRTIKHSSLCRKNEISFFARTIIALERDTPPHLLPNFGDSLHLPLAGTSSDELPILPVPYQSRKARHCERMSFARQRRKIWHLPLQVVAVAELTERSVPGGSDGDLLHPAPFPSVRQTNRASPRGNALFRFVSDPETRADDQEIVRV